MNLIILDTETSDLDPDKGGRLLELAWIELTQNGNAWEQTAIGENYIQYEGTINPHAQAVHHIRSDMLTEAMGAIKRYDAILTVLARMKPDTIVVAHNADFDCKFIPEITRPWLCTYRAAKHVWPGAPGYSNQVLRYWLKLDVVVPEGKYPHQALYDATVTTGLLLKMLERYTPEQLLQMSKLPVRLKNIGFGKHRGTAFENIPIDYLRWLRGQSNLDPDLKHTLDSILK